MAQTITIKQSSSTAAPTTLVNGELAYSSSSNKLWIGRPGGLTSNVDAIGGKSFTDKLDLIGANATSVIATTANLGAVKLEDATVQSVAANSVTATAARTYGIQLNSSNQAVVNVPWTATDVSNYMPLSGGTFTGDVTFGDGTELRFGSATGGDLIIEHTSVLSKIWDKGTGSLQLITNGTNIQLRGGNDNNTMATFTSNGSVTLNHGSSSAIKLATTATGVDVTGNLVTTGNITGPASFTITPATASGTVTIAGNLTVEGTTTTIDSTVLQIEDPHITLNYGQTGQPSSNLISGFIVDRGADQHVDMVWMENASSSGAWWAMADSGTRYQLLDSNNFETVIPTLNGGSF